MVEGQTEGEDSQNGWIDYMPACWSHWKDGRIATVVFHGSESHCRCGCRLAGPIVVAD